MMLGMVNPRNYVKGRKVIWIYLWWQGQIRCAQDLAKQMREMHAALGAAGTYVVVGLALICNFVLSSSTSFIYISP